MAMTCQEWIVRYMQYLGLDTQDNYRGILQLRDPDRGWMTGIQTDNHDLILFCASEAIHLSTEQMERGLILIHPKQHRQAGLGAGLYEFRGQGPYFVLFQRTPPEITDERGIEQSLRFLSDLMTKIIDQK